MDGRLGVSARPRSLVQRAALRAMVMDALSGGTADWPPDFGNTPTEPGEPVVRSLGPATVMHQELGRGAETLPLPNPTPGRSPASP